MSDYKALYDECRSRRARDRERIAGLEADNASIDKAYKERYEELIQARVRIAELEAEVADLKLSLELVALEKREARAEVKRLRADGCGGDPYCDCYVPPARAEEGGKDD
jgi:septal ring factor EnvC (AmiA/AmiB activator)